MTKGTFTLFGAEVSLFSGKTRAYLRYKNIPFSECVSSAKVVNGELYKNTGMRMIPVVKTPEGEYLQDTTAIMDALESRFPANSVYPSTPLNKLIGLFVELYADEWLLLPAMHYRWHYKRDNLWFILKEFGASAMPHWPKFLQPAAALIPAFYFGRLYKPVLGISKQNYLELEAFYESFLAAFSSVLDERPFLLGERPSNADFGLFGPLYAHLYRDPYSGRLMKRIAPKVAQWVERMNTAQMQYGEFSMSENTIHEGIVKILRHMLKTQVPVLKETIKRIHTRVEQAPAEKLPRFLGKMEYSLDKVKESRYVNVYAQWMLQRPLDYFASLQKNEQEDIRAVFSQYGIEALLELKVLSPIERRNNKLFPVQSLPGSA